MTSNNNCIFCKIVHEDIPSYKIAETEDFLAILDIAQFTEGHTIVIPKEHFGTIWDMPNIGKYFEFIQKVGNHLKSNGFKFADTITMGRMIPHAHVHIVPHNGDNKDWEWALKIIGSYQTDKKRRISQENGKALVEKLGMLK